LIPFLTHKLEKETIELMHEHVQKACTAVNTLTELLALWEGGNTKEAKSKREEIIKLEVEGDELRRKIEENLYSGAFLPISRSRILNFSECIDNIYDTCEDAAKLTGHLVPIHVNFEIREATKELLKGTCNSVLLLQKAVEQLDDVKEIKNTIQKIREVEHEVDEISDGIYTLIYQSNLSPKEMLLLLKLVEYISSISNHAENASDVISLLIALHQP